MKIVTQSHTEDTQSYTEKNFSVALCESSGFPLCKFLIDKTY